MTFEEWARDQGYIIASFDANGNYADIHTAKAFEAWQASRKSALSEAADMINLIDLCDRTEYGSGHKDAISQCVDWITGLRDE